MKSFLAAAAGLSMIAGCMENTLPSSPTSSTKSTNEKKDSSNAQVDEVEISIEPEPNLKEMVLKPKGKENSSPAQNRVALAEADVSLLQKSVDEALSILRVGNFDVNLFQDAYSRLHKQDPTTGEITSPVLYYSPAFLVDRFNMSKQNSELQFVLTNKLSPELARNIIVDEKSGLLDKLSQLDLGKVEILPISNVQGKLKAFGKTYDVKISGDFLEARFTVPIQDVPEDSIALIENSTEFKKKLDLFTIQYSYWKLQKNEDENSVVMETDEVAVDVKQRKNPSLAGQVLCKGKTKGAFSVLLEQSEWWNSGNFLKLLSSEISKTLSNFGGCESELQLAIYYLNSAENRDLVPESIEFSIAWKIDIVNRVAKSRVIVKSSHEYQNGAKSDPMSTLNGEMMTSLELGVVVVNP